MCMFEGVQSSWQAEEAAGEMLHVVHWAWQLGIFTANKKKPRLVTFVQEYKTFNFLGGFENPL